MNARVRPERQRAKGAGAGLVVLCLALSAVVFGIDLALPLGIAGGVPYVLVVLLALRAQDPRVPLAFATLGSVLTVAGFFLSPPLGVTWMVLVNRGLALFAIWVTALLGRQLRRLGRSVRGNRAQLRELADTLPIGVAGIDPVGGSYLYANPAYAALFALPAARFRHAPIGDVHGARFALRLTERCAGLEEGGSVTFEHQPEVESGAEARRLRVTLARFRREEARDAPLVAAVAIDLSANALASAEIQRQLAELAHVARLATMGELAAKLAHELNQPLAAISAYTRASLRLMRSGKFDTGELTEALEDASLQAERAADIIRGLRNFLRKAPAKRTPLDLPGLLDGVVRLVEHEAGRRRVEVAVRADDRLPAVEANRIEIEQVLFNLLMNALEAIPQHGEGRRLVTLSARGTDAGELEIAVADSGAGFVDGVAEHLFDPFFSTKQDGMGMGLSICRTIVEAHGGTLRANNNALGGATFAFTLPPAPPAQEGVDEA